MRDGYPAGIVTLSGSFLVDHREEIVNLAKNLAKKENEEHPLKRIMEMAESDEGIRLTTTDSRLARTIGDALARAYEGELHYEYTEDDLLRVTWKRDT